jgi:hypothetical protein
MEDAINYYNTKKIYETIKAMNQHRSERQKLNKKLLITEIYIIGHIVGCLPTIA